MESFHRGDNVGVLIFIVIIVIIVIVPLKSALTP